MNLALLLIDLLGALPLTLRRFIGRSLGKLFSVIPTRDRQFAKLQMECFLSPAVAQRTVSKVYAHLGQVFMESVNLFPLLKDYETFVHCPDWPLAETLLAQNRPIVALTAHTGNWDLLGAYMAKRGVPLTTIGREARNKGLQHALKTLRERYRIDTIWRSRSAGAKEIVRVLESRAVIAGLLDQDTRVRSTWAPFFGRPATVPTTLLELGKKHTAIFVTTFIFREEDGRYRIFIEPFPEDLDVNQIAALYSSRLESFIRRFPDQWVWFHKRWRTMPTGERVSGKQYRELLLQWKDQPSAADSVVS